MTGLPSETPEQGQEAGKRGGEMPVVTRADWRPCPLPGDPGAWAAGPSPPPCMLSTFPPTLALGLDEMALHAGSLVCPKEHQAESALSCLATPG